MNINIYNPYVREELYLMHHGILGQRWGKKNGPPYPLSAGAHSASEKKAGWRKSLDKSFGSTSTSRSKPPKSSGVKKIKSAIKKKIDSITPEQKAKAKKIAIKALKIAGAVAITAAVAYAGFKFGVNPLVSKKLNNVASKAAITERHLRANMYATENRILRGASTMSEKAFDINKSNYTKQFDKWAKADTISRRSNLAKRVYSSKGMNDLEKLKSQFNPYRIKQGWIHSNKNLR